MRSVKAVWFGKDAIDLYEKLMAEGIICQPFKDFVKTAFYDKLDYLKKRQNNEPEPEQQV
jgi:hypothetical protein